MLEATLIALDKASKAIMSWVGLVGQTASVNRFCQEEYLLKSLSSKLPSKDQCTHFFRSLKSDGKELFLPAFQEKQKSCPWFVTWKWIHTAQGTSRCW